MLYIVAFESLGSLCIPVAEGKEVEHDVTKYNLSIASIKEND